MIHRFWFYILAVLIIAGETSFYLVSRNQSTKAMNNVTIAAQQQRSDDLAKYLARQTDERKLVSLAKRLHYAEARTLQLIIDRAYELNPNSRDIALLASEFHPELKERIQELDPLYSQ